MAIRHISTALGDYMMRFDDNRIMLAGIFKNLASPTLPIAKAPCMAYVEFTGDVGDAFRISIEGNGLDLILAEARVEDHIIPVYEHQQGSIVIAGEIGLVFTVPGVFQVILRSGDEIVHAVSYGAVLIPQGGE